MCCPFNQPVKSSLYSPASQSSSAHLMAEWVMGFKSRLLWYRSSRWIWARHVAKSPMASISEKGNACDTHIKSSWSFWSF